MRRQMVSTEPAECFLHEYSIPREILTTTAKVNCTLTCDAAVTRRPRPTTAVGCLVFLVATELRPEVREIKPGSARIEDGAIVADWYTKEGGPKRRVYTMTADEARQLSQSLLLAADFTEGKIPVAPPAGGTPGER